LFGFVFPFPGNGKFLIFFLYQRAYVNYRLTKIGFVLHKIGPITPQADKFVEVYPPLARILDNCRKVGLYPDFLVC